MARRLLAVTGVMILSVSVLPASAGQDAGEARIVPSIGSVPSVPRLGPALNRVSSVRSMRALARGAAASCAGETANITGTKRSDELRGTSGDDVIQGLGGDDVIIGGGGVDLICGGPGEDILKGGGDYDFLLGDSASDVLKGGGGGDYLFGGGGSDAFKGGPGFDTANYMFSGFPINADMGTGIVTGEGRDTLDSIESLNGSDFADRLIGGPEADFILGDGGDDHIEGRGDLDTLGGDSGNDTIIGGAEPGLLDFLNYTTASSGVQIDMATGTATGGAGNDTFSEMEGAYGSEFADVITGSAVDEGFLGLGGNDTITGGDGLDILEGDAGDDTLDGEGGADLLTHFLTSNPLVIDLAAGTATGDGTDTIANMEAVEGGPADDTIRATDDFNIIFGTTGNDIVDGRGGIDYVLYAFATSPVTIDLSTDTVTGYGTTQLIGIEGAMGSYLDDVLIGDAENNALFGLDGDDEFHGGAGDDWLLGGLDDDLIDGGPGTFDLADFSFSATQGVDADLSTGVAIGEGVDTLVGVEALYGSAFGDALIGDGLANVIYGDAGDDLIQGREGDDGLDGGPGNNQVDGGPGTDSCFAATTPTSCESADRPPQHPLFAAAEELISFFKRHR